MKFFIDTANLDQIKEAQALGLLDGVTTNPSLMAKEGITGKDNILKHYATICELVDGDVSAEVISTDFEGMIKEARELADIADNIVVKIPLIPEGLKATRKLAAEGIATNVTLCFSANQALLAAKAGANYISPFIGRLDDVGQTGMDLIREIVTICDNYDYDTEVLVASVRHPMHVVEAAILGADVATVPFKVLAQLYKHPLTDAGLDRFLADWQKTGRSFDD